MAKSKRRKKTPEEIKPWAEEVEASSLYHDPEKRDFFPRRPGNSGSIRRRRRRSSGWKSTIEPLTRSKRRKLLGSQTWIGFS
jgi:hypothetical protein